ncbi:MAG: ribosomal-protein-alanine N-acetyltransferase [Candidatus Latescibacterota bacterium]|jgi:ribosomal-protein-alanine N-acetyltransferase
MTISDIYTDLPPLKTERLLLRKVTQEDLDDFYAWASDPDVTEHVTWYAHTSPDETQEFINRILNRYKHAKIAPWAIVHRQSNQMIGLNGFCTWDIRHNRAELAYVLSKTYWGQGYVTEASQTIITFGFQNMNLNRIAARCRIPNIGSARVMEKCGLTYEGTLREVAFIKNEFVDLKYYAILKKDWLASHTDTPTP